VRHFKTLVMHFSTRVSLSTGVWTKVWPSNLVNMECWGVRKCVCAVELFIEMGSITETWHRFCCELNQQEAPSPNSICRWVRQWCEEGSVTCKKPPGQPTSDRTPENTARVLASFSLSPRQSARKYTPALRHVWQKCMVHPAYWPESAPIQIANCAFFEWSGQRSMLPILLSVLVMCHGLLVCWT
jgi:hypothetical protein